MVVLFDDMQIYICSATENYEYATELQGKPGANIDGSHASPKEPHGARAHDSYVTLCHMLLSRLTILSYQSSMRNIHSKVAQSPPAPQKMFTSPELIDASLADTL